MPTLTTRFDRFDARVSGWMARHGVRILRISLGLVFLWFGALKFFPGVSPAEGLAERTIATLTGGVVSASAALLALAAWETAIGVGLIVGRFLRTVLLLLFVQMVGTATPVVLFPGEVFASFPLGLTMEGQYILKNLVLVSAALVIGATVRGGRMVSEAPQTAAPVLTTGRAAGHSAGGAGFSSIGEVPSARQVEVGSRRSDSRPVREEWTSMERMTMSDAAAAQAPLEATLKDEIIRMYEEVAEQPDGDFHFYHGRTAAELFEYDPAWLERAPKGAVDSFAGVGNPHLRADVRPGETVLDLGSGAGLDAMIASWSAGPTGRVIGIDLNPSMCRKAKAHVAADGGSMECHEGRMEDIPLEDGTVDVVISNGVINLSFQKRRVMEEMYRVLRPGGRISITDIVSGKQLSQDIVNDPKLWAA